MGPNFRRGRRRGLIMGAEVGATVANANAKKNDQAQAAQAPAPAAEPQASAGSPDKFQQLEQLAKLKEQGILTDAEFQAEKEKILAS